VGKGKPKKEKFTAQAHLLAPPSASEPTVSKKSKKIGKVKHEITKEMV